MSALSASTNLDNYERQLLSLITEMHEKTSACNTYMSCCCLTAACFVKSPWSWAFAAIGSLFGYCGGTTGVKNIHKAFDEPPQDRINVIFQKALDEHFKILTTPNQRLPLSKTEQELKARRKLFFKISPGTLYVYGLPLARDIQKCKDALDQPGTPVTFECDVKEETQRQENERERRKWTDYSDL